MHGKDRDKLRIFVFMKQIIIIIAALVVLAGCRMHRETERTERVVRDTVYRTITSRDTVALRDSIYISERLTGDTLRITEYRYRTRYRDRWLRDTVRLTRTDTLYRERHVETAAPRLTWWERVKAQANGFVAGLVAAVIGFFVVRVVRRRKIG